MFGPLALILAAAGVFVGVVVHHAVAKGDPDHDHVRGFALVGMVAMIMFAVLIVIVGLLSPTDGKAESLGLLALFGLVLYLIVAVTVIMVVRSRAERSTTLRWPAPAQDPADRDAGGDSAGEPADHGRPDQS